MTEFNLKDFIVFENYAEAHDGTNIILDEYENDFVRITANVGTWITDYPVKILRNNTVNTLTNNIFFDVSNLNSTTYRVLSINDAKRIVATLVSQIAYHERAIDDFTRTGRVV